MSGRRHTNLNLTAIPFDYRTTAEGLFLENLLIDEFKRKAFTLDSKSFFALLQ